ncbi:SNAP receptor [Yamadazyma tenuis]|uniref:t-SNARE coiled-coil homology domain-containing protein n=1 Tax=Candida tenuis (strain ATCC 10573 / BCRC 21748 / CBS 615 / JCM 9827 / NBRC 10315 / NRRL Y-1498 / VKM Y-70) TaxID=590646 RepID=G3BEU3_CANTC|nr:uncharacterized protein CANTEDRAFT_110288 [Yamadazyma tenuis ATCC 10573]EGV60594.1 hypothetical protein CANTEDRAFT_110288 [Yamadazyma tenuis ATCC 10573]WEJ94157.1 SNAP receptor [Yamadazyma tenuis]
MSFANFDLEAQKSTNGSRITEENHSISQNELDKIIDSTSTQLQVFGNLISQFESQRRSVGSKRDNTELRSSLDSLTVKLSGLERAIKKLMANLAALITKNSDEKTDSKFEITNRQIIIKERLVTEYNDLHRQYARSFKEYSDKKRLYPLKVTEATPLLPDNPQPQYHSQQQQQLQVQDQDIIQETELEYHRLLTEERNREIEQAAEGIQEVNTIFKDLGALIHQQGEQLDLVEDNIADLQQNTQQASHELTKAHEYQKKKGKWSCILLVALCIFVLVVVLAVVS